MSNKFDRAKEITISVLGDIYTKDILIEYLKTLTDLQLSTFMLENHIQDIINFANKSLISTDDNLFKIGQIVSIKEENHIFAHFVKKIKKGTKSNWNNMQNFYLLTNEKWYEENYLEYIIKKYC